MAKRLIKILKKRYLFILPILSVCYGQSLGVGDTIPTGLGLPWCANNPTDNDSLFLDDYNGAINEYGSYSVIWLMTFTSW